MIFPQTTCEWCSATAQTHWWKMSDGTKQGYFCSKKCISEAEANGFKGTTHRISLVTLVAITVGGVIALSGLWAWLFAVPR